MAKIYGRTPCVLCVLFFPQRGSIWGALYVKLTGHTERTLFGNVPVLAAELRGVLLQPSLFRGLSLYKVSPYLHYRLILEKTEKG